MTRAGNRRIRCWVRRVGGEYLIDHLERHQTGQFTEMTSRERSRSYGDGTGYGNLISQAEFLVRVVLE
jgi:hypothetical protein